MIKKKINNNIFKIFSKKDEAEEYIIENIINFKIKTKKTIILSGGTSPKNIYRKLSTRFHTGDNFELLLSDERYYGGQIEYSNFHFLKKNLIDLISFKDKPELINLLKDPYSKNQPNDKSINEKLLNLKAPKISIISIGEDGHIASLFDCKRKSTYETKNYFITKRKYLDFYRISLSFNYILKSKKIMLFAFGTKKNDIIQHLKKINLLKDDLLMPVEYILKYFKNEIYIICDDKAFFENSISE